MTNTTKKKHRRLKKRIRQTLGTLFLVSAIVVAAIPVDFLQASSIQTLVSSDSSNIPYIDPNTETIYSTGDGKFQFAYVTPPGTSLNKVAVILGFDSTGELANNTLTIPDTVDVYGKYTYNQGTRSGYVAVSTKGDFLYYQVKTEEKDDEGNVINTNIEYFPCYSTTIANWGNKDLSDLYIKINPDVSDGDLSNYKQTTNSEDQRIVNAMVAYIGKQYVVEDADKKWHASTETIGADNSDKAPFAGANNIVNLIVGKNLSGISDYAFYNCQNLQSVDLGNGLDTLGNWAFANCRNIKQINIDTTSKLQVIGDHAFYNCQGLTSFQMPTGVIKIGDSAFENCTSMENIGLTGTVLSPNVALTTLGANVFKNCRSLKQLEFPESFGDEINVSTFEGCNALGHITFPNNSANIVYNASIDNDFDITKFMNTVLDEFYLEGLDNGAIHTTATDNTIAFRYLGEDIYEKIVADPDDSSKKATFQVNSSNTLIRCDITSGMETVDIPSTIGPYKITRIDSQSFQDNCFLKKIVIPASITTIAENAFKGCHDLEHVVFQNADNIEGIGSNAFQTQDIYSHRNGCRFKGVSDSSDTPLPSDPKLTFTGTISSDGILSVPFQYAMDPGSNINKGTQNVSYITYYSGWPSNLEVKYNETTDKNELIDYPTFAKLSNYTKQNYPYITDEYAEAANTAAANFFNANGNTSGLTSDERQAIDASLNIVLPRGIESVKEDLFVDREAADSDLVLANQVPLNKTITTDGITEIPDETFKGCSNLVKAYINGDTQKIGKYAFKDCERLAEASISATVSELGTRPFAGCPKLTTVDFQGSPYFTCEGAIIYGLTDNKKTSIVECLESRGGISGTSSTIEGAEVEGISSLYEEAFAGCPDIGTVNLEGSSIVTVSQGAFRDTSALNTVYLPKTCTSIGVDAFKGSNIRSVYIPSSVGFIDQTAFDTNVSNPGNFHSITFYCKPGSNADVYAGMYDSILSQETSEPATYTVLFVDTDGTYLADPQQVEEGEDAIPPEDPVKEGKIFKGWNPGYTKIGKDTICFAQYDDIDPNAEKLSVEFYDFNNNLMKTELVDKGSDASSVAPKLAELEVEGYTFDGWRPSITEINENTKTYAQYTQKDAAEYTVRFFDYNMTLLYTQTVKAGGTVIEPKDPVRAGYKFTGWLPTLGPINSDTDVYAQYDKSDGSDGGNNGGGDNNNGGNNNGDNNNGGNNNGNNNNNNNNVKYYTLTVKNGSGSGSYVAGASVIVIANDPAEGQEFSNWTIDPTSTAIASKGVSATVITMPENAVTVTANYAAKGTTETTTGSGNSSSNKNNSSNKGNGSSSGGTVTKPSSNGTTVVIDKNGLSNTGVVSATVNGSSDNFVIKVTESTDATEKIVKALMNEYGDLTDIKYFPMDISLYDSTGNTKITDTTGLSISITLPLPDSLIPYAGNNKVAGVVNEKLDKLTPKFSTINGVACVTFTAEHFSPYVIYVDTTNLTAGEIADNTPKTGDGIHPKWFLSIGLACISLVLFMKRDKRTFKARKVTA